MNEQQAFEVLEGAMLSDGGLYPNSQFDMTQSGEEHLDWLRHVGIALEALGVMVCPGYPKLKYPSQIYPNGSIRKAVYRLTTRTSEYLKFQRSRWYPDSVKEVPVDLLLTPVVLANWFVGDGDSYRDSRDQGVVGARLATQGFSRYSVRLLSEKLHSIGIRTTRPVRDKNVTRGSGERIVLCQDSVDKFMEIVELYIGDNMSSYLGKVKYKETALEEIMECRR